MTLRPLAKEAAQNPPLKPYEHMVGTKTYKEIRDYALEADGHNM